MPVTSMSTLKLVIPLTLGGTPRMIVAEDVWPGANIVLSRSQVIEIGH